MEPINSTIEGIFNYFIEIIKETQKNGYGQKETISCLVDLHINALNILEQIGNTEEEKIYIKAMIYDCLKKREEEKLKDLYFDKQEGASHE